MSTLERRADRADDLREATHTPLPADTGVSLDAIWPGRAWLPLAAAPDALVERLQPTTGILLDARSWHEPAWQGSVRALDRDAEGIVVAVPGRGDPVALEVLRAAVMQAAPVVLVGSVPWRPPSSAPVFEACFDAHGTLIELRTSLGTEAAVCIRTAQRVEGNFAAYRMRRGRLRVEARRRSPSVAMPRERRPVIDLASHNPIGWEYTPSRGLLTLGVHDPIPSDLHEHRGVRILCDDASAADTAQRVVELAARGVPVMGPGEAAQRLLSSDTRTALTRVDERSLFDDDARERLSVAIRRAALRDHADVAYRPPASVLLATRRPHLVERALAQFTAQTYHPRELILALHGRGLAEEVRPQLEGFAHERIIVREVEPGRTLGEVLGVATDAASGTVVTKMDDDDHYSPYHIEDLVTALRFSGALLVGKRSAFVYLAQIDLTVRRRGTGDSFRRLIAGGTLTIRRDDLLNLGRWVTSSQGSEDTRLIDSVQAVGEKPYQANPLGFVLHRDPRGHTWEPGGTGHFLRNSLRQWPGLARTEVGLDA